MRRAASIGLPAGCGLRSTTARSTRSWPTACRATCRAFAGSVSTSTRRCIKPTSATRRRAAIHHMSGDIQYLIRHTNRFTYSAPISESVMEVRMQPRGDGRQRCLRFELTTQPRARVFAYQDSLGNVVHHFDIPEPPFAPVDRGRRGCRRGACPAVPESLPDSAWDALDTLAAAGQCWDSAAVQPFCARFRAAHRACRTSSQWQRDADPLTLMRRLTYALFHDVHVCAESKPASIRRSTMR